MDPRASRAREGSTRPPFALRPKANELATTLAEKAEDLVLSPMRADEAEGRPGGTDGVGGAGPEAPWPSWPGVSFCRCCPRCQCRRECHERPRCGCYPSCDQAKAVGARRARPPDRTRIRGREPSEGETRKRPAGGLLSGWPYAVAMRSSKLRRRSPIQSLGAVERDRRVLSHCTMLCDVTWK